MEVHRSVLCGVVLKSPCWLKEVYFLAALFTSCGNGDAINLLHGVLLGCTYSHIFQKGFEAGEVVELLPVFHIVPLGTIFFTGLNLTTTPLTLFKFLRDLFLFHGVLLQ